MEITDIKKQLQIAVVLEQYNLIANKNHHLKCPFHKDDKPSLRIYPKTNTYTCFGCGKTGDTIQFIQDIEKISKHQAIKKAETLIGQSITIAPTKQEAVEINYKELFPKLQAFLPRSKKAVEYLKSRNLYDIKIEIGYNSGKDYKQLKNCLIFPLKNQANKIVSFYGRSVNGNGKHYYTTNRKGLYPAYPSQETKTLILTESIIDTATVNKYTDYKALALYGTNGLTAEIKTAIVELEKLEEIILFFDGDEAGTKAVEKYSKELNELKPTIKISQVATSEEEDPNSLLEAHEPEILTHLIESRTILFSSIEEKNKLPAVAYHFNTKNPDYLTFEVENILISILGGIALHPLDKLKITLKIERTDSPSPLHSIRHSLDLYNDDQTEKLIRKASERLETGSREIQVALSQMINELERYRLTQIEQQKPKQEEKETITEARKQAAIQLLKSKNLLKKTNELIGKTGMVGEENNRLLMYLVFTSRLREQPLHIISLGASGTGKTYLQEKI